MTSINIIHKKLSFDFTAKTRLKKTTKYAQDNRLSKREFRTFVQAVTDEISGADSFDYYIDFLTNSVEVRVMCPYKRF